MNIAKLMKMWRVMEGKTTKETGESLGLSSGTVTRIERGRPMSQETILKLFNMLFGPIDGNKEIPRG